MKVLVAGSHGFIGGYLCKLFIEKGWEVIGVDNINMFKPKHYELFLKHYDIRQRMLLSDLSAFYRKDCTNLSDVFNIIRKHEPDIVVNLAATSVADVCVENTEEAIASIYRVNANMLEALKRHEGLRRYVFISSSMVYGDFECEAPDENAPKHPKDPYGAIKLGAEVLTQSFGEQFGLRHAIVRPSAVYGPLDSNMRVSGIFMLNAHHGRPLRVVNSSEQLDFTYVEDTVQGIYLAATHSEAENEVFNITYGRGRTILELAREIKKYYPAVEIIEGSEKEFMPGLSRPSRGSLCIEKARNLLGYEPKYSLERGIEHYVNEWRKIYG